MIKVKKLSVCKQTTDSICLFIYVPLEYSRQHGENDKVKTVLVFTPLLVFLLALCGGCTNNRLERNIVSRRYLFFIACRWWAYHIAYTSTPTTACFFLEEHQRGQKK
jgi:hypothetical protein